MLHVNAEFRDAARKSRSGARLTWPVAAAVIILLAAGCWLVLLMGLRLLASA